MVIDIDSHRPCLTGEIICVYCYYRYIGTWPVDVLLKDLKCPNCEQIGYIIGTGQILEYGDLSDYNKDNPKSVNKPGQIVAFPREEDI